MHFSKAVAPSQCVPHFKDPPGKIRLGKQAGELSLSEISSTAQPTSITIFGICHAKHYNFKTRTLRENAKALFSEGVSVGSFKNGDSTRPADGFKMMSAMNSENGVCIGSR